ncbi:MAG: hypothetical protein EAZ74_02730 [Alphaproteobacteria bacterium]|nr:MAG: hypothetical protein EAY76_02080 [Alphaproteobacteria bacterium]TAF14992.1 MAG: hypothetical protein EAZ74_02730 [Alphaproteobacteria bacterium]TAF40422.1 MAG: hypothetical protein EAZ66_03140 [Alphaproteobacteria bacterium]TAF76632.1 MAG: hypothetical protein EAZ52_03670 [Alphaproteobacteria bacterium]
MNIKSSPTISSSHDAFVMVYDDATHDRLALLERVQGEHNWTAHIVIDNANAHTALETLRNDYAKRSCRTTIGVDENNRTVLEIDHLGRETSVEDAFLKFGFAQGATHAARSLKHCVTDSAQGIRNYIDTPMKMLSGLYCFGDVTLGLAGFFDRTPDGTPPPLPLRVLKATSTVCNILQSFIFLKYGQDDSIHHLYLLNQEIERQLASGNDQPIEASLQNKDTLDNISDPLLKNVHQFLLDHPMETGVAAWNLGQALVFTSGLMRLRQNHDDRDAMIDMARAVVSFTGWSILLVPRVHTEEKTSFWKNPIECIKQHIQEDPQHLSAMGALGASLVSMNSSNPVQKMAESSYLAGDVSMFFLQKDDYGEQSVGNPRALTEAIASFLERQPILFSPTTQRDFIKDLSEYLAQRAEDTLQRQDKHIVEGLAEIVQEHVAIEMTKRNHRFEQVTMQAAALIAQFPPAQHDKIREELCAIIEKSPAVDVNSQELRSEVQRQQALLPTIASRHEPPPMADVSEAIAKLTFSLPPMASTDNAMRFFETLRAYRTPNPAHEEIFQQQMVHHVATELGVPPQQMQQWTKEQLMQDREAAR